MNVALSALPRFPVLPEPGRTTARASSWRPSLDYMDRAYLDARATAGRASRSSRC